MVNLDDMAARALVPEQLPHYVQSVSALRPVQTGPCLGWRLADRLVLVAYPDREPPYAPADLTAAVPKGEIPALEYDMPDSLPAGMQMGDAVGEARILLDGRTLASVPLVLTESLTPRDYAFELERVLRCWPLQGEPLSQ